MKSKIYLVHFAVLLFGLAGVIAKAITLKALLVTFYRVLFSSITLFLILKFRKSSLKTKGYDLFYFMIAGIVLGLHWFTFMHSIQISSVAIGTVTFSTFPMFVVFLEPILYKEPLTKRNILFSILLIVGVIIMSIGSSDINIMGILIGMFSSFLYAVLSLMNRYFSSHYDSFVVCFYEQLFACISLLPFCMQVQEIPKVDEWIFLIILGIICTALAHSLYVYSLRFVSVSKASMISSNESVYSILLSIILLRIFPSIQEVIGGSIIFLVNLLNSGEEKV